MKVTVDLQSCVGHGRCNFTAPRIFELDELGYCSITEATVGPELMADAQAGADACPERAISIHA